MDIFRIAQLSLLGAFICVAIWQYTQALGLLTPFVSAALVIKPKETLRLLSEIMGFISLSNIVDTLLVLLLGTEEGMFGPFVTYMILSKTQSLTSLYSLVNNWKGLSLPLLNTLLRR